MTTPTWEARARALFVFAENKLRVSGHAGPANAIRAFLSEAPEAGGDVPQDVAREYARGMADGLERAAVIADEHWPETGHVHTDNAVSCPMSISILIRRAARSVVERMEKR